VRLTSLAVLACTFAFACGSSTAESGFGDGGAGSGNGNGSGGTGGTIGGSDGGSLGSGGEGGTGLPSDGCSDAAKLIYVLSEENDLYSFYPPDKKLTKIGPLGCKAAGLTPNSMAVSRDATAWVNYADSLGLNNAGSIFKVSTANASCQPTTVKLSSGWYRLGMGFSTDGASSTNETLYVAATGGATGGSSKGLGKIDLAAQALVPIGSFTGSLKGKDGELTGTGDGRLFGFFTTTPVEVAQIDKATGATSASTPLGGVETPAAWAFSFWGGDFYLYTAPDATLSPNRTTNVTRYRPSDGSVDAHYMDNIGFRIVGAGVSTCAPTTSPR
jgi:hypothetical protein